jgi:hypothetical protein
MLALKLALESHEKCATLPWHRIQV